MVAFWSLLRFLALDRVLNKLYSGDFGEKSLLVVGL